MTPIVHICIDFETAALGERAAILSAAAVPFLLPSDNPLNRPLSDDSSISDAERALGERYYQIADYLCTAEPFHAFINATTCVMAGMEFDPDTVRFWANQTDEAKLQFATADYVSVRTAFEMMVSWMTDLKATLGCDIRLWSQGTDFDIPKLRYCCTTLLGIDERDLPWRYYQVCDARSYVVENLALLFGRKEGNKAIYADIPQCDASQQWERHSALGDAQRTVYNVQEVNQMLMERFSVKG